MKEQIIRILKAHSYYHTESDGATKSQFKYIPEISFEDIADEILKIAEFEALCNPNIYEASANEHFIDAEVEKRIKERMPSDELIEEIQEKSLMEYENAPICEIDYYSGFEDGVNWLRFRLTNNSQKTEGGK